MKKIIFLSFLVLALVSCAKDKMLIKGKISNAPGNMIYFEEVDIDQTRKLDSLKLNSKGKFCFTDRSKYPKFYQLRFENDQIITLLLEPGKYANISADFENLYKSFSVTGSEGTRLANQLNREFHFTQVQLDSITRLFNSADNPVLKDSLSKEYEKIMENHRKFSITFILTCNNSLTSLIALYQQYSNGVFVFNKVKDLQYFKIVTDSLIKYYPRVKQVIALKKNTETLLNEYYSQKLLSLAKDIDYGLPEIILPDLNEKNINLKSLKGKYVLLSFWSTWNEESNGYNLGLKDVYKKYKRKGFEIYHVSLDKSVSSWKRAVVFDELNWINVIDTAFPNSKAATLYNVQALPANYLIDKDFSTIVAKDINPAQLESKLAELFN